MRYLHEQPGTVVYLMDQSPQSRAYIESGVVSSSTVPCISHKPYSVQISGGKYPWMSVRLRLPESLHCRLGSVSYTQSQWSASPIHGINITDNVRGKHPSSAQTFDSSHFRKEKKHCWKSLLVKRMHHPVTLIKYQGTVPQMQTAQSIAQW